MKPNQLHHLCFILYRDSYNKPTELEEGTRSNFHLCQSIRDNCMQKLKSLYYSPHRVCGCLFQDSVWPNLQKVVFDTMDFVGCKKTSNGNRTKVLDSFDSARMPRLRWPAQFQLGIPHIHFQRAVLHVDESDADHQDIWLRSIRSYNFQRTAKNHRLVYIFLLVIFRAIRLRQCVCLYFKLLYTNQGFTQYHD